MSSPGMMTAGATGTTVDHSSGDGQDDEGNKCENEDQNEDQEDQDENEESPDDEKEDQGEHETDSADDNPKHGGDDSSGSTDSSDSSGSTYSSDSSGVTDSSGATDSSDATATQAADTTPGNDNSGDTNGDGTTDSNGGGNDDQGKDDQGKDDQGKDDQGKDDEGKDDEGKDDQGKDDEGNEDEGNEDEGNENEDCPPVTAPGLTLIKHVVTNNGGNEIVSDFPLKVNGAVVTSGTATSFTAGVPLAITETQKSGYAATNITCVSSVAASANNSSTTPSAAALGTVTLAAGESVVCTITNDDIAPTVTVHKEVVGGPKHAADFQMTVNGTNVAQDTAIPVSANTPIAVSEVADANYVKSVVCADTFTNHPVVNPPVLDEGQNVRCVVTNTFQPPAVPTITVVKNVINNSGGTLVKANFNLKIDSAIVAQDTPITVSSGVAHTVSEETKPGYAQTGIVCVDSTTQAIVGQAGSVTLTATQHVMCTVTNDDIPAGLTVVKQLIQNSGGQADPASFQLKIDNVNAPQALRQSVDAGLHTITEVPVAGWVMTGITCNDDDANAHSPVTYIPNVGITLALGQHVTCIVFNDDLPVDLVITKSDDGQVKVAGGAPFNYTITVDNLGPRDVTTGAAVTVTDQLPAGLHFVLPLPAGCTAAGQTLTCSLLAADLQVTDPPVVIVVSVAADADAASGTYTNKAFVDTADDHPGVTVCGSNNSVACENTDVRRESSVTITKDDGIVSIHPGGTFSYTLTATNTGPSTISDLHVTDDLPVGLSLVSVAPVSAAAPWSCNAVDPVNCTYVGTLQPNASAPPITITVTLAAGYLLSTVVNRTDVTAVVNPLVPPTTPGAVVTGTATETTPVVRTADLGITKAPSQAATTPGGTFNWLLTIINNGPDTATNVMVDDTLPVQFTVTGTVTATGGFACTQTVSTVHCTALSLANGASGVITIPVTTAADAVGPTLTNTAVVTSDTPDAGPTPNTSTGTIGAPVPGVASEPPVAPAAIPPAVAPAVIPPAVSPAASSPPVPAANPPVVTPQLPRTGNRSLAGPLDLATLLLVSGIVAVTIARRRRSLMT